MTNGLRDHFAGLAMQAITASQWNEYSYYQVAEYAYKQANAMMAARGAAPKPRIKVTPEQARDIYNLWGDYQAGLSRQDPVGCIQRAVSAVLNQGPSE